MTSVEVESGARRNAPDEPPPEGADTRGPLRVPRLMVAGTSGVVAVTLVIAFGISPLWNMAERAAQGLVTRSIYVQAVLGDEVAAGRYEHEQPEGDDEDERQPLDAAGAGVREVIGEGALRTRLGGRVRHGSRQSR